MLSFFGGYHLGVKGYYLAETNDGSDSEDALQACKNMTTEETSFCLRNKLKEFYYYNISNIGKALSINRLKKEGGVCWHYSNWYCSRARDLGFFCERVSISTGQGGHSIAVISGHNDYCMLDQTIAPKCNRLELINQTTENN